MMIFKLTRARAVDAEAVGGVWLRAPLEHAVDTADVDLVDKLLKPELTAVRAGKFVAARLCCIRLPRAEIIRSSPP